MADADADGDAMIRVVSLQILRRLLVQSKGRLPDLCKHLAERDYLPSVESWSQKWSYGGYAFELGDLS